LTLSRSEEDYLRLQNIQIQKCGSRKPLTTTCGSTPIEEESNPKPYNFKAKCEYCGVPLVRCSIRQRLIEYLNFGSTFLCLQIEISWLYVGLQNEI
jgi:hypothetical protein